MGGRLAEPRQCWGGDQVSSENLRRTKFEKLEFHPLFQRFENELMVGEHDLEWTTYGRDFFFRPQEAEVEVIWCCLEKRKYAKHLCQTSQAEKLAIKLADEIEIPRAWRFWPLTENCELFFASRHALVRWNEVEDLASFDVLRGGVAPNRLFSSTDDLQKLVENCLDQIEKLGRTMKCAPDERTWQNVLWPWGTHKELRSLIRGMGVLVR